jgi:hypothetical protein
MCFKIEPALKPAVPAENLERQPTELCYASSSAVSSFDFVIGCLAFTFFMFVFLLLRSAG